jgi:ribosome-associated protein
MPLDRQSMAMALVMQQLNFELDREFVELNQLLKLSGLCDSGGAGKALVASGAVSVDGVVELRKTCKIRAGQVVRVGDAEIRVTAIQPVT